MDTLQRETARFGCIKGFLLFDTYIRGREELVCIVRNHREGKPMKGAGRIFPAMSEGLPPASPSAQEVIPGSSESTVFLIGAYSRYDLPFVWLRTNHNRMIAGEESFEESKDKPLQLRSTDLWKATKGRSIRVWDIVEEIIKYNVTPAPSNPFAVNFEYFQSISAHQKPAAVGSMICFLRVLLLSGRYPQYASLIFSDVQALLDINFESLAYNTQLRLKTHEGVVEGEKNFI